VHEEQEENVKVVKKPRGVWLVDGKTVLSEVLNAPGATNSLFDVIAASIAELAPGRRVAVLGFAAGGFVAPLRALDATHEVIGVDLEERGAEVFRDLCASWAGDVRFERAEACEWLHRQRRPFDAILEDLSEPHPTWEVVKPWESFEVLPDMMAARLKDAGVVVVNLLPWPDTTWKALIERVSEPFECALVVTFEELENRLLLLGHRLETASVVSRRLRKALRQIGSNQSRKIAVRTIHRTSD